jgi:hypothetical protein
VLAVDHEESPELLVTRLRDALIGAGVHASIGAVTHEPGADIEATCHRADLTMYLDKRQRKQRATA